MAPTVPRAEQINAGGTTTQDFFEEWHAWLSLAPGNFTIENEVGTPITSYTLTHGDGWQVNHELDTGVWYSVIAPDGGIVDSTDPTAAANTSPRDVLLPAIAGTSQLASAILYGDAFFLGLHDAGETHYEYAFHHGKILIPTDLNDPSGNGIDGLGVFAYLPEESSGSFNAFTWFCTNSTASNRKSYIRVGTSAWATPALDRAPSSISAGPATRKVCSMNVVSGAAGAAPSATNNATIGTTKYFKADVQGALVPYSIRASAGSDQGWLSIRNASSTSRMRMLTDKTETP